MGGRRLFAAALLVGGSAATAQTPAPHHDVLLEIDPQSRRLEAVDRISLPRGGVVSGTLAWDLEIQGLEARGRPLALERVGERWTARVDSTAPVQLTMRYAGTLPMVAAARRGESVTAFAGAEGVFLPAGSGWLPRTAEPWIRHRVRVEVPAPYRAVATGRLDSETDDGRRFAAEFVADHPGEGPSVFVGRYAVQESTVEGVRLRTYFPPDLAALAPAYLQAAALYLQRFAERIGAYPFADFGVVAAPVPVGLGFPGLTYVDRRILPLPYMQGRSLAHEVLHNWWGNGVYVDYAGGNWSEGLTTYLADYGVAEQAGPADARRMRLDWLRDYAALPAARDRAVREFQGKTHDAAQVIGYNKVAFLFHMLRNDIGEAAFTSALRTFWREHRFLSSGWEDLQAAFELASGRSLEAFFAQWLERRGAPHLQLLAAARVAPTTGADAVRVELGQSPPVYRLRVPIRIDTVAGPQRHVVDMDAPTTSAQIDVAARALGLAVDPDYELFRRLAPGESPPVLRDVTLSDTALTVIAAEPGEESDAAAALAEVVMDTGVRPASTARARAAAVPLLIVATDAHLADVLRELGLPAPPPLPRAGGSAAVWTLRADDIAVMVVSGRDAGSLRALARPLPHYGRQSYIVFEGGRAVTKGLWEATQSLLSAALD